VFDDNSNNSNPIEQKTARLRRAMWQQLKAIGRVEQRSMNEVIEFFLRWAIDDWKRETRKFDAFRDALADVEREESEESQRKAAPKRAPKRKA